MLDVYHLLNLLESDAAGVVAAKATVKRMRVHFANGLEAAE